MSAYGTALAQGAGKAGVSNAVNLPFNMAESAFNYYLNEKAAKNADKRQRQQFHDLYSIQAQLKQIKDAGLSPSLMYGGVPSQGGASAPQGGTRGGGSYTTPLDTAMMTNIENTQADTNLKNAEADNLRADTTNKEIQNYIDNLTKDTSVQERQQNLQVLVALGTKYLSESQLNIATKDKTNWETTWSQIKSNEELKLLRNQNALYLAQIVTENTKQELNQQQTDTLSAQIDKWQMDVSQRYYELDIQSWSQQAQENWWQSQADNLIDRLEFDTKKIGLELDFSNKKMWIDNAFDIGKSAVIATGMVFTRGSVNLGMPKVTFGQPKKVGF